MSRKRSEPTTKPIPVRVQRVLDSMAKRSLTLCRGYRPRVVGVTDRVECYWFEPTGKAVGPDAARKAIALKLLIPQELGLLGDGNAQSFALATPDLVSGATATHHPYGLRNV